MRSSLILVAAISSVVGGSSSSLGFQLEEQHMLALVAPYSNYNLMGAVDTSPDSVIFGHRSPNLSGVIWSKTRMMHAEWQMLVKIRISGDRQGGDGLALWYAKDVGEGPVFGAPDRWTGLGIMVDTFDDDGRGNNPAIMGILNDGQMSYLTKGDGEGQYFGGCLRNVKNLNQPLYLRVTYMRGAIKVELDDSKDGKEYVSCFEKDLGGKLSAGYHFGVSGATGLVPDGLEIMELKVWGAVALQNKDRVPSAEKRERKDVVNNMMAGTASGDSRVESKIDGESLIKAVEAMLQAQLRTFMPQIISGNTNEAIRKNAEKDDKAHQQLLQQIDPRLHAIEESLNALQRQMQGISEHLNHMDPNHLQPVINRHMDDLRDRIEVLRSESHHHINAAVRDGHLEKGRWTRIGGWVALAIAGQLALLIAWLALKKRMEDKDKKWM